LFAFSAKEASYVFAMSILAFFTSSLNEAMIRSELAASGRVMGETVGEQHQDLISK